MDDTPDAKFFPATTTLTRDDATFLDGTGAIIYTFLGKKRIKVVPPPGTSEHWFHSSNWHAQVERLRQRGLDGIMLCYSDHRYRECDYVATGNSEQAFQAAVARVRLSRLKEILSSRPSARRKPDWHLAATTDAERQTTQLYRNDVTVYFRQERVEPARQGPQRYPGRPPVTPPPDTSSVEITLPQGNVGHIYVLEYPSGEQRTVHLRLFSDRQIPQGLPAGCISISGESLLGGALLHLSPRAKSVTFPEKQTLTILSRRIFSGKSSSVRDAQRPIAGREPAGNREDHADGHFARERNGFGSYPLHDQYGDGASGEERDFEDYPEYAAHYGE